VPAPSASTAFSRSRFGPLRGALRAVAVDGRALRAAPVWASVTSDVLLCGSSVHTAQAGHAVRRWHPRHAPARAAKGREVRPCPLLVSSSAARPVHEAAYHRVPLTRSNRQLFVLERGGHGAGPTGRRFP